MPVEETRMTPQDGGPDVSSPKVPRQLLSTLSRMTIHLHSGDRVASEAGELLLVMVTVGGSSLGGQSWPASA
jgi:hypothetical protein